MSTGVLVPVPVFSVFPSDFDDVSCMAAFLLLVLGSVSVTSSSTGTLVDCFPLLAGLDGGFSVSFVAAFLLLGLGSISAISSSTGIVDCFPLLDGLDGGFSVS